MALINTDVVTRFAFQGSIEPLTKYNATLGNSVKLLATSTAAIGASMAAFSAWVTSISQGQDALGQLSRQTGVSVEALNELGYAAEQNGSSAETLQSSMSSLSQKIGEAATRGSEDFARLGISIRDASGRVKTADQVFLELSKRVNELNLSQQQTQDFASRLGIDQSLVQLLGKSSDEINALRARAVALGRTTTEQSDTFLKYNDTISEMRRAFDGLQVQIAVGAIPQLQELARTMTEWVVKNSAKVADVFAKLIDFGSALVDSFKRMTPVLAMIAAGFITWKIATMGLTTALNALAKTAVIAALIGIYLAIDDLITAFQGGKSVIADFYKNLFDRDVVDDLKSAFTFVSTKVIAPMVDGFKMLFDALSQVWDMLSKVGKAMISMGGSVLNFVGIGGGDAQPQPNAKSMLSNTVTNTSSNSTINQQVQVDVRSSDPVRAGEEVASALSRQTEDAYQQAGRGAR